MRNIKAKAIYVSLGGKSGVISKRNKKYHKPQKVWKHCILATLEDEGHAALLWDKMSCTEQYMFCIKLNTLNALCEPLFVLCMCVRLPIIAPIVVAHPQFALALYSCRRSTRSYTSFFRSGRRRLAPPATSAHLSEWMGVEGLKVRNRRYFCSPNRGFFVSKLWQSRRIKKKI